MLPSKNPHEPNSFLGIQPPHGVLHFLSLLTCDHPWFKKDLGFKALLKGFKAI
jgi:hypothetical protein